MIRVIIPELVLNDDDNFFLQCSPLFFSKSCNLRILIPKSYFEVPYKYINKYTKFGGIKISKEIILLKKKLSLKYWFVKSQKYGWTRKSLHISIEANWPFIIFRESFFGFCFSLTVSDNALPLIWFYFNFWPRCYRLNPLPLGSICIQMDANFLIINN